MKKRKNCSKGSVPVFSENQQNQMMMGEEVKK